MIPQLHTIALLHRGTPSDGLVQKYNLFGKWGAAVQPMADDKQTLLDASIEVTGGQTILKFTKLLDESGEIEIYSGENVILYARGHGTSLGYHAARMAFNLNLG